VKNIRRISTFQVKALRLQLLAIVTPDEKPSLKASILPLFCSGRYTNESLFILLALPTLVHTVEPPPPKKKTTKNPPQKTLNFYPTVPMLLLWNKFCYSFVTHLFSYSSKTLPLPSARHCLETRKNNIINTNQIY
jgi:hypothetical protein